MSGLLLPSDTVVVVISGPGGVGKGTLVQELVRADDGLWLSRSWTTRAPREGERPDAYHFVTPEEFQAHIDRDGFLEWIDFLDYRQGSPLPEPPAGSDVLFEIDVQGAARIHELHPEALLVFVDAPDRAVQEDRLRGRGDSEERIAQRLAKAEEEVARSRDLPFVRVVNDDLDRTVAEIGGLIDEARKRAVG
ncbi:guanylate kinase [Dermatobacter hominis]|uniref:guanylate kinase n=1 Tax=Dermatobacter hominis TaxID=2884263 RepID=UPI001D124650|nr:guanylate kinase [Dermatobacter hominis]UDY36199.1 guanylate kinase [Dermatobacter hominis]